MKRPSQYPVIAFDAYGTLFDVASIDRRLAHHFGGQAPALATLWRQKQLEYTWLRTLMQRYNDFEHLTEDALRYACRRLGQELLPAVLADLMHHYRQLDLYPEVAAALEALRRHSALVILSNANQELLERAVEHNRIGSLFDGIFSVEPLRKFKPSPDVYRLPLEERGLAPHELLFVSANAWDVAGAASAGLPAVWVRRTNGSLEELDCRPGLEVDDLAELAGLG